MSLSVKCQVCNNKTTNPSGMCHLHEEKSPAVKPDHTAELNSPARIAATIDNIKMVQADDRLSDFAETELGGQFYQDTLRVERGNQQNGETSWHGFGLVEEPFAYGDVRFDEGDEVIIDLESQEITKK